MTDATAGAVTDATPVARHDATEILAAFAVAARAAGIAVTTDRTREFLRACCLVGADDMAGVYWSGRATLCAGADDLVRYDQVFASWFDGEARRRTAPRDVAPHRSQASLGDAGEDDSAGEGGESALRVAASSVRYSAAGTSRS